MKLKMTSYNTIVMLMCRNHRHKQSAAMLRSALENFPAKSLFLTALLILALSPATSWADDTRSAPEVSPSAYVAIIIDDLGYKLKQDQRAVNLPGQVTFAFLPHTPHVKTLAEMANANGSDIMLHLPMQAMMETFYLGPGALTSGMTEAEFKQSVIHSIRSIPHIKGINNHMGSLITSQKDSMQWLMDEITQTDLYFVDSRTTAKTLAEKTAERYQIKNTRRNIFLDHELNRPAIEFQFNRLIKLARKNGSALAIGHPFRETLDVLEEKIPQLKAAGIQLVSVSELIEQQQRMRFLAQQKKAQQKKAEKDAPENAWRNTASFTQTLLNKQENPWQTSLSPSPKAAKN